MKIFRRHAQGPIRNCYISAVLSDTFGMPEEKTVLKILRRFFDEQEAQDIADELGSTGYDRENIRFSDRKSAEKCLSLLTKAGVNFEYKAVYTDQDVVVTNRRRVYLHDSFFCESCKTIVSSWDIGRERDPETEDRYLVHDRCRNKVKSLSDLSTKEVIKYAKEAA